MKKNIVALIGCLIIVTVIMFGTVSAEIRPERSSVGIFTGGYVFSFFQDIKHSPIFGLRAGYDLTDRWGLEGVFDYVRSEDDLSKEDVNAYVYRLESLYYLMPDRRLVPFGAIGVGGITVDPSRSKSRSDIIADYGVGVKYFLSDQFSLRGDVRHIIDFIEDDFTYNHFEYTFGLTLHLGSKKTEPVKAAAITPPPVFVDSGKKKSTTEMASYTTAPTVIFTTPVNGATAVPVNQKVHVAFSEPMDPATITSATFTLKQGITPVLGTVSSVASTATFTPASDLEKGTTYTATTAAGARDLTGNALANNYVWTFTTVPAPKVALASVALVVLEDNHFGFDKSDITKQGAEILDANIKILNINPKIRIRIAGYTSAQGTQDYNQKLSERRAAAVLDYLIKGGITPDRLTTIGFGEMRPAEYEPVPENMYSKEAQSNMRVLFEVIVK